jgi:16S rRNA (uracil1498-N3)-methyltransferase
VIEASKQCGRNRLMEIAVSQGWQEFLAATAAVPNRLLAHPLPRSCHADVSPTQATEPAAPEGRAIAIAIGPEGGFTEDEVHQATAAGWRAVDLGSRILRVETAAIALAIIVAHQWGTYTAPGTGRMP